MTGTNQGWKFHGRSEYLTTIRPSGGGDIYLLGKRGYVFGSVACGGLSVCLFVCLLVDNITQKVINGFE